MFFTKNYIAVRVYCPERPHHVETVYVYGIPHKQTFDPIVSNGCDSLHGCPACEACSKGIVKALQADMSLLERQPFSPILESR